jgi:hypothetical protein
MVSPSFFLGASQRTSRQIMQFPGALRQTRSALRPAPTALRFARAIKKRWMDFLSSGFGDLVIFSRGRPARNSNRRRSAHRLSGKTHRQYKVLP